MLDSIHILDKVHELKVLVNMLHNLKVFPPEAFQVEQLHQNFLQLGMTIERSFFTCKKV